MYCRACAPLWPWRGWCPRAAPESRWPVSCIRTTRIVLPVARPPRKTLHVRAGVVGHGDDLHLALPANAAAGARRSPIRTYVERSVVVLEAAGPLGDAVEDLDLAIKLALADGPRGVACDLSAVPVGAQPGAVDLIANAGRHVRDWPGIPLALASPDPQLRAALATHPLGAHLIIAESISEGLCAVLLTPTPAVERLHLTPHPTAPRASRNFVTRTLLGWGLGHVVPSATLVVSELVTNSAIHAGTQIDLSVDWDRRAIRLTVRDHGLGVPHLRQAGLGAHGRGLTIVLSLSRAFGFLPTADGGKVVWAVLEVPPAGPLTCEGQPDLTAAFPEPRLP